MIKNYLITLIAGLCLALLLPILGCNGSNGPVSPGLTGEIHILTPNFSTEWRIGEDVNVLWVEISSIPITKRKVFFSVNDGDWEKITSNSSLSINDNTVFFTWVVPPNTLTGKARIRVEGWNQQILLAADESQEFVINPGPKLVDITILNPPDGSVGLPIGVPVELTWIVTPIEGRDYPNFFNIYMLNVDKTQEITLGNHVVYDSENKIQMYKSSISYPTPGTWDICIDAYYGDIVGYVIGSGSVSVSANYGPISNIELVAPSRILAGNQFELQMIAYDTYSNRIIPDAITVNWGDGTGTTVINAVDNKIMYFYHRYFSVGFYVITVVVDTMSEETVVEVY